MAGKRRSRRVRNRNKWISYQTMSQEEKDSLVDHEYAVELQAKVEAARAKRHGNWTMEELETRANN
jgi:hypothetical protein